MTLEVSLPYANRAEAGRVLAGHLLAYRNLSDVIVLGLPRGGVVVAHEVALVLGVPLDVMVVRKLGVPGYEELAMGAIASGGYRYLNRDVLQQMPASQEVIDRVAERELAELRRREQAYRGKRPEPKIEGQRVILVDDGLATASTMWAAILAVQSKRPARTIVAAPVAPPETVRALRMKVDEVVVPATPERFRSVGQWYDDFEQVTDEEVCRLLSAAWGRPARSG